MRFSFQTVCMRCRPATMRVASAATCRSRWLRRQPSGQLLLRHGSCRRHRGACRQDRSSVVLTHEIGTGWGLPDGLSGARRRRDRRRFQLGQPKEFSTVSFRTRRSTGRSLATFTGPAAEAAYGAAIGAGGPVPVPLYVGSSNLAVESFYHLDSNLGIPLLTDLMSPFVGSGSFVPISDIDLAILRDIGMPVTANVECFGRGTLIETTRGSVAVEDLRPQDQVMTLRGVSRPVVWTGPSAGGLPAPPASGACAARYGSPRVRSRLGFQHATLCCRRTMQSMSAAR